MTSMPYKGIVLFSVCGLYGRGSVTAHQQFLLFPGLSGGTTSAVVTG
jgi:hypothetical protein